MTCLDFENRLQVLLDRRQHELPEELSAHMTRCAACHELWDRFQRMQDAVIVWRVPAPTVQLSESVLQHLQNERDTTANSKVIPARPMPSMMSQVRPHRHSALTTMMALVASALAMLIAVGVGWQMSSSVSIAQRPTSSQAMIAANSANRAEVAVSPELGSDRQLDVLLHDARDAYVALASQAWQQVSTTNVLLPPTDMTMPFRVDQPAQGLAEPLSRPLAPLGKDIRDAVDSLFQQVFSNQDSST